VVNLARISKTLAVLVIAALGWSDLVISSASKAITAGEWHTGGVMLAIALGVYTVPNAPAKPTPPPLPMHIDWSTGGGSGTSAAVILPIVPGRQAPATDTPAPAPVV
jgi:hypothetical protein